MSNKQYNKELLEYMLKKDPAIRFVFFRRYGGVFNGDLVDIPINHALSTIKQNPDWELTAEKADIEDKKDSQVKVEALNGPAIVSKTCISCAKPKEEKLLQVPSKPRSITDREFYETMSKKESGKSPGVKPRKFVYVKNHMGRILDIPVKDLAATLKQPGMVLVSEEISDKRIEAPVVDKNPLECPICGFKARSVSGLGLHNKKHK